MNRWRKSLFLTLCVLALLTIPLYGQKTTGLITGDVTDPSGAMVANATVSVTSNATGQTRTATTDTSGTFTVPDLQPGMYQVTIKAQNFKESIAKNVEVHVASTTPVNIKLQMGGSTETVEVTTSTIQVQTDSAVLGETIDSTQVRELPLNGRNFMGLTQLAPGVSTGNSYDGTGKGLKGGVDFSVNGNAVTNNLYLVDGANNNDRGSNRTILIYPSVDSIAEFKMLQNSYGPEYGQSSGAVITMVTKSGTNQFHGDVFYSGRNDAINAWDYFARQARASNAAYQKPKLRRSDYGFSLGGPAIKDKLFFFYSQEWNKETRGIPRVSCVPSLAERGGDFSTPSCGAHRPADANGVSLIMPANQKVGNPYALASITPLGQDFINWFPEPNQAPDPNGNNWADSLNSKLDWRQENARVDFNLTKNNVLMGRFTQDDWNNPAPGTTGWGDSIFPTLNSSWAQPSKMIIGKMTSTIGSTIVNDAEFSYSNNRINILPGGTNPGLIENFTNDAPTLYPNTLKNSPLGVPNTLWGGFSGYGGNTTFWVEAPWNNALDMYSIRDDISKVAGSHTFKAGFLIDINSKDEDSGGPNTERLSIGGVASKDNLGNNLPATNVSTGNNLVDYMQPGLLFNLSELSTNVRSLDRWRDYEFYFGDTWKARKNLTIEYGVRYSFLPSPYNAKSRATSFQPSLYDPTKPASDACNGLMTVPGTDPCGDANALYGTTYSKAVSGPNKYLMDQNHRLFAPRLGLAWDPSGTGNWAVRFGIGQFFQRDRVTPWFVTMNNAPFSVNSPNYVRSLGGPTPTNLLAGSASPGGGFSTDSNMPNSWQWNLAVEHTFAKETALQVAYVGNSAIHQLNSYDINVPDPSKQVACPLTLNGVTTTFQTSTWTCGAYGIGGSYNSLLRPFGNDGTLAYWDHSGHANYHALQTVFKTKYKRSQFTAAYTWSHSIGNIALDDSSGGLGGSSYLYYKDAALDRGNSPINRPHIFVANGTYFFPELKGSNGFMRNTLGGWEVSGITQATSGHSLNVQNNVTENGTLVINQGGTSAGKTYGAGSIYGLNTGTYSPLMSGSACNAGMKQDRIVNPSAFTLIGQQLGVVNDARAPRGYCLGPHFVNTDLSIDKNWKLTERIGMQFRLDLFDLFNHANFNAGAMNIGPGGSQPVKDVNCGAAVGGLYQACSPTNNTITRETLNGPSTFGNSTGTIGNHGRELQYGLRITF
jgi:hypothetical protein